MKFLKTQEKVKDYSGSSEHLKKDLDIKKTVDGRLRIFIIILLVCSIILVTKAYDLQMLQAEHFENLYEEYQTPPLYSPTVRGELFDRNMVSLVSNKANKSIRYYPPRDITEKKQWEVAGRFAQQFGVKHELNVDDEKVLWLRLNDYGASLITSDERKAYNKGEIKENEYQELLKSRITDEHLATLSEADKDTFNLSVKMQNIEMGQSAVVLDNVTDEQIAYLSEHQSEFPGFNYATSWNRQYNDRIKLGGLFGSVGDIPSEKLLFYSALSYQHNDKLGTSGLEYQYESLLSGVDSQYIRSNSNLQLSKEGRKGYDLLTSLDVELQEQLEKKIVDRLESVKTYVEYRDLNQMHVVITNPNTGEILAIAAMKRDADGAYWNDVQSTMLSTGSYPLGSTVKPATVYMALDQKVMTPDEKILDTPMLIYGMDPKGRRSWKDGIGYVNAQQSLQMSSNIYMFNVAIRLGGSRYVPNGSLSFPNPHDTYNLMRSYYSQFGLGVDTQVDYPREEMGYKGSTDFSGTLLDFAIGQFDNYNAMQLNQLVSTIANGGHRLAPKFVTEALDHDTKNMVFVNETQILNTIDNYDALTEVQKGMRLYITSGEGYREPYETFTSAAKSGTAQDYAPSGTYSRNYTYIAYAPYEAPQIAVSCIAPYAVDNAMAKDNPRATNQCGILTHEIMNHYFTRGN